MAIPDLRILTKKETYEGQRLHGLLPKNEIASGFAIVRSNIIDYWNSGDIEGVLEMLGNSYAMAFVFDNNKALKDMGQYEKGLLCAYQMVRTNLSDWPTHIITYLFDIADPEMLRAAGDDMPICKNLTLYRGVSGKGCKRRVSGHSWTDSLDIALWFSKRFELADPAVYRITVPIKSVLARLTSRNESEFILRLPLPVKPRRIPNIEIEVQENRS